MPTLAVGMLETWESFDMPTASVGMAPYPAACTARGERLQSRAWRCQSAESKARDHDYL